MEKFERELQLRWSDMDPNFHLRHSVYYDFAAKLRMDFLVEFGLTPQVMMKHKFGPILFREEAVFRKEIHYSDKLMMNVMATHFRKDYSRFGMRHEITRDGELCAILNVDGAFIDTMTRKLTQPPQIGIDMIEAMPRSEDFRWD